MDSAGYQDQVIEAAERHHADFTVTAKGYANVNTAVHALAVDPYAVWSKALGRETEAGSQIAETTTRLLGRELRLIVRRQPRAAGEQLAFDDLERWRLHAIITNIDADAMTAAEVEAHHRLRGGIPEDNPGAEERLRHDPRPGPAVLRRHRAAGFACVVRSPGGRMVAYDSGAVVIDHITCSAAHGNTSAASFAEKRSQPRSSVPLAERH